MREFVAKTGGRYTYIEDFIGLQDLTKSIITMFGDSDNFIVSGCETSGISLSNTKIASGYVYINGHIRKFDGATVDLTKPYYIVETERTESVSYAQNATQQGCVHYECTGTTIEPIDKSYIKLTSTWIPRLKDKFFGKYALLLDPQVTQQVVSKPVIFGGGLESAKSILSDGALVVRDSDNIATLSIEKVDGGSVRLSYSKQGDVLSYITFGADGLIRLTVNGKDKLVASGANIAFDQVNLNSLYTENMVLTGSRIDALRTSALEFNKICALEGTTKDLIAYNGRETEIFRVEGATQSVKASGTIKEESSEEYGLVLKDTAHNYRESAYKKAIAWKDNNGVVVGSVGYAAGNNDLVMYNEFGNVTLRGKKITFEGTFEVNGSTLDSQYASKTDLTEGLAKKVDAVSGMGLSEQNFTSAYKAQLDSLKTGSVQPGDGGLVSGDQVSSGLADKLSKSQNLADVNSKEAARSNLNVYSKNECDANYARANLSNLPELTEKEKSDIRTKIGAGASGLSQQIQDVQTSIQKVVDDTLAAKKYASEADIRALMKDKTSSIMSPGCSLGITQVGYTVTIGGTITCRKQGQTLFTIPSGFGLPATALGGSFVQDISKEDLNKGIKWTCASGSGQFLVDYEYLSDGKTVPFYVTYTTTKLHSEAYS